MTTSIVRKVSRAPGIVQRVDTDPTALYSPGIGMPRFPVNFDLAATGSTQTDAAPLSTGVTRVTGADGTKGVLLPAPDLTLSGGEVVILKNNTNAVLKLWPATGGTINAIGANSSMSIAALTSVTLINMNKDPTVTAAWYTLPLLPS